MDLLSWDSCLEAKGENVEDSAREVLKALVVTGMVRLTKADTATGKEGQSQHTSPPRDNESHNTLHH